jgi:hypothetical protein
MRAQYSADSAWRRWSPSSCFVACEPLGRRVLSRRVKELEWIEMAQLAVSSILFKSLSLKLP